MLFIDNCCIQTEWDRKSTIVFAAPADVIRVNTVKEAQKNKNTEQKTDGSRCATEMQMHFKCQEKKEEKRKERKGEGEELAQTHRKKLT